MIKKPNKQKPMTTTTSFRNQIIETFTLIGIVDEVIVIR